MTNFQSCSYSLQKNIGRCGEGVGGSKNGKEKRKKGTEKDGEERGIVRIQEGKWWAFLFKYNIQTNISKIM